MQYLERRERGLGWESPESSAGLEAPKSISGLTSDRPTRGLEKVSWSNSYRFRVQVRSKLRSSCSLLLVCSPGSLCGVAALAAGVRLLVLGPGPAAQVHRAALPLSSGQQASPGGRTWQYSVFSVQCAVCCVQCAVCCVRALCNVWCACTCTQRADSPPLRRPSLPRLPPPLPSLP